MAAAPHNTLEKEGAISEMHDDVDRVEKQGTVPNTSHLNEEEEQFLSRFSEKEADRIYRKVDWHLVPLLTSTYLLALIDRANIGNAKIEGLEKSLGMTGNDYNVVLAIFFVPYIIFEIPSNHILSRFKKPSTYMGLLVVSWGIVTTFQGVVRNFGGLMALRILLGVFEAGFFPGSNFLVSQWYPPNRTQKRIAVFYTAGALSGAFSGLLAYGIRNMDGLGGYESWRWIFIIEGIVSVLFGVACFFFLPDSPGHSKRWLSPDEQRFLELTQIKARGRSSTSPKTPREIRRTLWKIITDWQLYLLGMVFMSNTVPNYGLKFTMPQIIKNMGFTAATAQLLTIPPYTVGAIAGLIASLFGDKFSWRMPSLVIPQCLLLIGYAILVVKAEYISSNIAVCFFAVHVACAGLYPIPSGVGAWTVNNLGPNKRPMGIAWMTTLGSIGGIIGSFIYTDNEAPRYPTGFGTSLAFGAAGVVSSLTLDLVYWKKNKSRAKLTEEEIHAKYTPEQLADMDDRSPLFRYNL